MTADDEDRLLRAVGQQNAESIRALGLPAERQARGLPCASRRTCSTSRHDGRHGPRYEGKPSGTGTAARRKLYGWSAEQAVGKIAQDLLKTIFPAAPRADPGGSSSAGAAGKASSRRPGRTAARSSSPAAGPCQRDESSAPVAILVTNNDITERRRARSTPPAGPGKELRDFVDAVPAFVWSTLPDGGRRFRQPALAGVHGPVAAGGMGMELARARFIPTTGPASSPSGAPAVKNGRSVEGETRVRRADGEFRWWFLRSVPLAR